MATSVVVVDSKKVETPLRAIVDGVVECVGPTPTPTITPTPPPDSDGATPTSTPEQVGQADGLSLGLFCDHRIPGQESDVIAKVEGLEAGQKVAGTVSGPGVIGDGSFGVSADDAGVALARVPISEFGTYEVAVNGLSDSITVGKVCEFENGGG
jgi:hypothetical protein